MFFNSTSAGGSGICVNAFLRLLTVVRTQKNVPLMWRRNKNTKH